MTEQQNNQSPQLPPSGRFYKWLFYLSLAGLLLLFYYNQKNRRDEEEKFRARSKELSAKIAGLEREKSALTGEVNAKNELLSGYSPYLSLIKNLKLIDTAYKSLPFRYGQHVLILPDSSDGIINSLCLTANQLEYSVRYMVRNKKGEMLTLSVSDLQPKDKE